MHVHTEHESSTYCVGEKKSFSISSAIKITTRKQGWQMRLERWRGERKRERERNMKGSSERVSEMENETTLKMKF
jgi:hypothetical protein